MSNTGVFNDLQNKWYFKDNRQLTYFRTWLLFSIIAALSYIFQYPFNASVDFFMLADPGGALKGDYLITQGYSPTIDFTYNYGLLPLSIGRIWFEIFGRTPQAYLGAMLVFNLLIVAALTRIVFVADLRRIGIIFIACTIPFSIMPSYPNFTHALEALLIYLALGEHISGRKHYALVLLTVNLFVKPSMSYVYIFLILVIYGIDLLRKRTQFVTVFFQVLPAGLIFIFLLILMGINFGIIPIFNTIIPIAGSQNYKANNYGFFTGIGRHFWYFPQVKIGYYLGSITGFWIFTTVILFLSVVYFSWQIFTKKISHSKIPFLEVQFCILLLHLSFVLFFFGNSWSWFYYSYLLPIGLSFLTSYKFHEFKKIRIFLFCMLISLILLGYRGLFISNYRLWHDTKPQTSMLGLYASSDYTNEFMNIVESCKRQNVLILSDMGATDLFFPKCHMPNTWYTGLPFNNLLENARISQQFSQAKSIIIPTGKLDIMKIKLIRGYLGNFQIYRTTKNFIYLNKK